MLRPLLICLLVAGTVRAEEVPPEAKAQARAHYEQGTRLYDMGKYDEAATEFQRSFEASGSPDLLFNLAQAFRQAHRWDESLRAYRGYLRRVPEAPNREYVDKRIEEVQAALHRQQQETAARAAAAAVAAAAADRARAAVLGPAPAARPVVERSPAQRRALRRAGYVLAGLTAGALAGGIAGAVLSHSTQATVESDAQRSAPFTTSLQHLYATGRSEAIAGDVCFAAAGVFAVAGVTTLTLGRGPSRHEIAIAPAPNGITVAGAF